MIVVDECIDIIHSFFSFVQKFTNKKMFANKTFTFNP